MCFSLAWLEQFLVWLIIVCAVVTLLRLLISFVIPKLGLVGEGIGFVVKALTIIIWATICIALVYFIFDLIICLGPWMPRLGRL
jgi:hypothetical protein